MIIIGILLMVLMFGGMIGGLLYVLKKTDPSKVDTSVRTDITTAQEFLPFQRIKDSMLHMGNHTYRAIIEVSSINYDLKTEKEQRVIEMSYTQFLNSLMFPITIFISTREIDNTQFIKDLREDYENTLKDYPEMIEYANENLGDMTTLNAQLGTTRHKKKYIIVSYDEANELSMQTDDEKYEHSAKELATRARIIQEGLMNLNIQTKVMTTPDILELMISTYHRNGFNYSDEIWNKNYLSMIVEGEKNYFGNDLATQDQLDLFVKEFENRVKTIFLDDEGVPYEMRLKAEEVLSMLKGEKIHHQEPTTFTPGQETAQEVEESNAYDFWADDHDDEVDDFLQPQQMNWQGVQKQ